MCGSQSFKTTQWSQIQKNLCKKVRIVHVAMPVIQEERDKLQERWDRCKAIPQTHSVHFAARASASTLAVAKNPHFFQKDVCQEQGWHSRLMRGLGARGLEFDSRILHPCLTSFLSV